MPKRDPIPVRGNPAPVTTRVSNLGLPGGGISMSMVPSDDLYIASPVTEPDKTSDSGSGQFVGV